jgi:pimeloyl-ACP methyl ester carboxylesterase
VPGLSRNARDFEPLARKFSRGYRGKDRVIVVDLRGRGQSDYDDDANNYNPIVEAQDVMLIMDRLRLDPPVLIGTSRGGIIAMMIASMRLNPFSGVVFNDIGPVIELEGLLKIKSYVGKAKVPETWDEAEEWVTRYTNKSFPGLTTAECERMTRRLFRDVGGKPVFDYDPKLSNGLEFLNPMTILPQLWPQFAALTATPALVIRGALSDILSEATVAAMAAAHPGLQSHVVPAQGHAPLLEDDPTLDRIGEFLNSIARKD